jgi:hypothetical protein
MKAKQYNLLKAALIWVVFLSLNAPAIGQKHGGDVVDIEQEYVTS